MTWSPSLRIRKNDQVRAWTVYPARKGSGSMENNGKITANAGRNREKRLRGPCKGDWKRPKLGKWNKIEMQSSALDHFSGFTYFVRHSGMAPDRWKAIGQLRSLSFQLWLTCHRSDEISPTPGSCHLNLIMVPVSFRGKNRQNNDLDPRLTWVGWDNSVDNLSSDHDHGFRAAMIIDTRIQWSSLPEVVDHRFQPLLISVPKLHWSSFRSDQLKTIYISLS